MRVTRFVTLFLLAYLCLDFANPMMPGAVQFVDGAIQIVQADRARSEPAEAVYGALPLLQWIVALQIVADPVGRPRLGRRLRRHNPPCTRRTPDRRADSTASSEDH